MNDCYESDCETSPLSEGSYYKPYPSPPSGLFALSQVIEKLSAIETIQNDIGNTSQESSPTLKQRAIKIDKLYDGTEHVRKCGDCMANTSSSHWNTDAFVVGGHLCQKCYRRRRRYTTEELRTRNIPPLRSCTDCNKCDQSSIWFKHPSLPYQYVCENCCSIIKSKTVPASAAKKSNQKIDKPAKRTQKRSSITVKSPIETSNLPLHISLSNQNEYLCNTLKPLYLKSVIHGHIVLPSLISLKDSIDTGYQNQKTRQIILNPEYPALHSYFAKVY